jgi:hypothetical protein
VNRGNPQSGRTRRHRPSSRLADRLLDRLGHDDLRGGNGPALEAAVDALATYRIVRLIQEDTILDGPREQIMIKYGHLRIAELMTCPWCLSVWVGMGVAIARVATPRLWGIAARGLASSAGASLITGMAGRLETTDRE